MTTKEFEKLFQEQYKDNEEKTSEIFKKMIGEYSDENAKLSVPSVMLCIFDAAYIASCQFTHDLLKRLLETKED